MNSYLKCIYLFLLPVHVNASGGMFSPGNNNDIVFMWALTGFVLGIISFSVYSYKTKTAKLDRLLLFFIGSYIATPVILFVGYFLVGALLSI